MLIQAVKQSITSMQALIYNYGKPQLVRKAIPSIHAKHREVLVKVIAAGVNPVDAKNVFGDKLPHTSSWLRSFNQWYIHNSTPGFDFAGVVEKGNEEEEDENDDAVDDSNGQKPHRFKRGDAVFGTVPPFYGSFQEYIVVPVDQLYLKPTNVSFHQAAAMPLVGLTCLQSFQAHDVGAKDHVLVIGASGGTGHVATQMAKALGARVVAICGTKHFSFVQNQLGADVVLNYQAIDWQDLLLEEVERHGKLTFVFDSVTSADAADAGFGYEQIIADPSKKLLEKTATYLRLGGPSSDWVRAGLRRLFGWEMFRGRRSELFWVRFPKSSNELKKLKAMVEEGRLQVIVSQVYDFSEEGVAQAFEALKKRRTLGKIVLAIAKEGEEEKNGIQSKVSRPHANVDSEEPPLEAKETPKPALML